MVFEEFSFSEISSEIFSFKFSFFADFHYPNEIGPGVYDIHSARVPETQEMVDLLKKAERFIDRSKLWVNPDCGLKTRGWAETKASLIRMVEAAKELRNE